MDLLKLINQIINSLTQVQYIFLIILVIIIYHVIAYLLRDKSYIKRVQQLKNKKRITIRDLTSKPLITFVIPAWKEEKVLELTLNSILSLSYPNYKVIVNAGGNKDTIRIANSFRNYDNFTILKQEAGKGKIKAINDALEYISEGIIYLMDADVQVNDHLVSNMLYPIINENENVVTAALKPHNSIIHKDLVKFLYIDRNNRFRKKLQRYIDVIGIITAMNYNVIQYVIKFTQGKFSDDGRVIGKDLKSQKYKIYFNLDLLGETYNYPNTISNFIPQQLRWMENAFYRRREERRKLFIVKKTIATLISIYLLISPFLFFNINLIMIGLYILLFIYLEKIRKIIFYKKTDASLLEFNLSLFFYIKIIFYIYLGAFLNIIVAIEIIFFKSKYKKRKNII